MPYDNTNRLAIWKNDDRTKDTQPHFKGSGEVICPHCRQATEYWVSAWKRKEDAKPKAPALSMRIEPKEKQSVVDSAPATVVDDFIDDDIPF